MPAAIRSHHAHAFGDPERYAAGLTEVAPGVHAWLQPNGAWGESNAGLVVGAGESLLVDTLRPHAG